MERRTAKRHTKRINKSRIKEINAELTREEELTKNPESWYNWMNWTNWMNWSNWSNWLNWWT